ncbi:MAG: hypothetical protein ACI8PZ_002240 [Myxococcota bacterium]|jgi:hypothetical protein
MQPSSGDSSRSDPVGMYAGWVNVLTPMPLLALLVGCPSSSKDDGDSGFIPPMDPTTFTPPMPHPTDTTPTSTGDTGDLPPMPYPTDSGAETGDTGPTGTTHTGDTGPTATTHTGDTAVPPMPPPHTGDTAMPPMPPPDSTTTYPSDSEVDSAVPPMPPPDTSTPTYIRDSHTSPMPTPIDTVDTATRWIGGDSGPRPAMADTAARGLSPMPD